MGRKESEGGKRNPTSAARVTVAQLALFHTGAICPLRVTVLPPGMATEERPGEDECVSSVCVCKCVCGFECTKKNKKKNIGVLAEGKKSFRLRRQTWKSPASSSPSPALIGPSVSTGCPISERPADCSCRRFFFFPRVPL